MSQSIDVCSVQTEETAFKRKLEVVETTLLHCIYLFNNNGKIGLLMSQTENCQYCLEYSTTVPIFDISMLQNIEWKCVEHPEDAIKYLRSLFAKYFKDCAIVNITILN